MSIKKHHRILKIKFFGRIILALVLSFFVSKFLTDNIFLNYSPTIRQDVAKNIWNKTNYLAGFFNPDKLLSLIPFQKKFSSQIPNEVKNELTSAPKSEIQKGIYVKETNNIKQTEIHYNEIEWEEVNYLRKSGTTETIRIPKGTNPPPPQLF